MDEVIFEEFKGTGNSEIQLNRSLSNKRIFPAIDLVLSSTRRDDLLLDDTTLNRMWIIRKFIAEMTPVEAMNTIRDRLVNTRSSFIGDCLLRKFSCVLLRGRTGDLR